MIWSSCSAEKARIEAQIKAAEAASRMKAEIELKKQREKEREAARTALQKVKLHFKLIFHILDGSFRPFYGLLSERDLCLPSRWKEPLRLSTTWRF